MELNGLDLFFLMLFAALTGALVAYLAKERGRGPAIWFILGFLFGLLALVLVLVLPAQQAKENIESKEAASPEKEGEEQGDRMKAFRPMQIRHHFYDLDWHYVDDKGENAGPITFEQLQGLWKSKGLSDQSYVWNEEMSEWKVVETIPNLTELLQKEG